MFSINFSEYHKSNSLNSLITKCVHTLCTPVSNLKLKLETEIPSLYDLNIDRFDENNTKAPYRLIESLYQKYSNNSDCGEDGKPNGNSKTSLLNEDSRQIIIDYILRERISVRANFLIQILNDGGVNNFDLWQLNEINQFSIEENEFILEKMLIYSKNFLHLSLGGVNLIYPSKIINGVLKKFLCNDSLINLRILRIQQIPPEIDFISLLKSCPNLEHLEISEPSLDNRNIFELSSYLLLNPNDLPVCKSLRKVLFPSSVQEDGLVKFLYHFPNIAHLHCTPFEQLLDLLDDNVNNQQQKPEEDKNLAENSLKVLGKLRSLSLAHPMSENMIDRLIKICPKIKKLSLHLQKRMNLSKLANGATFLEELELNNCDRLVSFNDNVVPILEGCGKQLKTLSLINFDEIDLTKCAQYCPNLETFNAQCFTQIYFQNRLFRLFSGTNGGGFNKNKPFSNLKYLKLRPRPDHTLPVDIFCLMVKYSPYLQHIELYSCTELNDEKIFEIKKMNSLENLQTFILRHGHNVTNQALCHLISLDNLVFHDCGLVPPNFKPQPQQQDV